MKTKQILTILFFLLLNIQNIQSQSVLSQGTEWYYNHQVFWQPGNGYNRCYIEGDTVIDEKECYIYKRGQTCDMRPMIEYIYEEDDKLYYYENSLEEFLMLYDYSAETGDTITLEYWPNFNLNNDSLFYIRVDSIDYVQYDTLALKRFYVTYNDPWQYNEIVFSETYNKGIIIEGIGSLTNFFHFFDNGICDGSYNIGLRCFDNPNYGLIQFMDVACDYVSSIDILDDQFIEINPNPFVDHIYIESTIEIKDAIIVIYDISGNELIRKKINGKKKLDEVLDLSNYPASVYILNIYEYEDSAKLRYAKKIVKTK